MNSNKQNKNYQKHVSKTKTLPQTPGLWSLAFVYLCCWYSHWHHVPARPPCQTGVFWCLSFLQEHQTTPRMEECRRYLQTFNMKTFLIQSGRTLLTDWLPLNTPANKTKLRAAGSSPTVPVPFFPPPCLPIVSCLCLSLAHTVVIMWFKYCVN